MTGGSHYDVMRCFFTRGRMICSVGLINGGITQSRRNPARYHESTTSKIGKRKPASQSQPFEGVRKARTNNLSTAHDPKPHPHTSEQPTHRLPHSYFIEAFKRKTYTLRHKVYHRRGRRAPVVIEDSSSSRVNNRPGCVNSNIMHQTRS